MYHEPHLGFTLDGGMWGPVLVIEPQAQLFLRQRIQFRVLREMHLVRDFRLVLCAQVFGYIEKQAVNTLKGILEEEERDGGLDCFLYKPLVMSGPRRNLGLAGVRPAPRLSLVEWFSTFF